MGILGRIFGRKDKVAPQSVATHHVVHANIKKINRASLKSIGLDQYHWVITQEGVGIITGCDSGGMVDVTMIKSDGLTKMVLDDQDKAVPYVISCEPKDIRRAYIEEVPSCRHPGVDHHSHMKSHGYSHGPEVA